MYVHARTEFPMGTTFDNSEALATFIARKTEFDTILSRVADLSRGHSNQPPEAVSWADAGTLDGYLEALRRVSGAAFHEGEQAT
jgi:hypothetical protein